MSLIPQPYATYARLAAWAIGAAALAGGGAYLAHRWDATTLAQLRSQFDGYKVQVAQADAAAQAAARNALQVQITKSQDAETNNAKIIADLTAQRDTAAADRDFAQRLLAAAAQAKPTAAGGAVSETTDQPAAAVASGAPGDGSLAALIGDAAGECVRNAQRLDALQREIAPQL
jgi:hypothetical protein